MLDLTGKCALVTGAAGGIGAVVARKLHAQGATVALTDMRAEPLEEIVKELGDRAYAFACNLGEVDAVKTLAKDAEEKMGKIDILVNNAGLTRDGLFMRMKDEDWQLVIDVNLTASFKLAREVLRGMMKRRYGRIIGLASVVGVTGNAGQANYSASKAGLIGMTKCLAAEVASRGITANCVAPGFISTPMTDVLTDEQKANMTRNIPMGTLGTPDDVTNAIMFLASDESSYITGQTIHVNGGMAMI
jgi:3-oxoacyl-[acyl-carrier protein] reductase